MECPCRDCNKRHVGCHAKCKGYLSWKKEWDRLRRKRQQEEHQTNLFYSGKPVRRRK